MSATSRRKGKGQTVSTETKFPDPPPGYHYGKSRTFVPHSIRWPFGFLATSLWYEQRPADDLGECPVIVDAADVRRSRDKPA